MGRIRAGLKFNIGKHGRIYIPLGGGSKKRRSGAKAKPAARSTAAAAAPEVTVAEPSVGVAVVTGLMSLLLLVGLFFALVAVTAFARHRGAGDILGGIVCAAIALAGLYFGGLGLVSFITCVKALKEKKAGKGEEKVSENLSVHDEEQGRAEESAQLWKEAQERETRAEAEFVATLDAIPSVEISISEKAAPKRSVSEADDLPFSNITKKTPRDKLSNFVAIDTETTGLYPSQAEIVEISASGP